MHFNGDYEIKVLLKKYSITQSNYDRAENI